VKSRGSQYNETLLVRASVATLGKLFTHIASPVLVMHTPAPQIRPSTFGAI